MFFCKEKEIENIFTTCECGPDLLKKLSEKYFYILFFYQWTIESS